MTVMAIGRKRPVPEEENIPGSDDVHPSRKRRLENGQSQAELSKIIDNLRDEVPEVRIEATKALLKSLSAKSDERSQRLEYCFTRLVKGVCSGAKAARPGFSIALAEVLRLGFAAAEWKLVKIVDNITLATNPDSKAVSEEKRNDLIGRRFAFQALLQSGVLTSAATDDAKYLFDAIAELASEKEWLRGECGAMLHEFLKSKEGSQVKNDTVRALINSWLDKGLLKSPEGVVLWLAVKKTFSDVKLPKGQWHHNDPLSSQERSTLGKILQQNAVEAGDEANGAKKKQSGARQIRPSFAWDVILGYLYKEGENKFSQFWEECVATSMFSTASSTERKALGLQIFTKAIGSAPAELLQHVVHPNIVRCILDQRAKSDRALFEAAKVPLNQMVNRAKNDDADAGEVLASRLLTILPPNVDKLTRSTLEGLLGAINDNENLANIVAFVLNLIRLPRVEDSGEAEKKRRVLADVLLTIIRARRGDPDQFFDGTDSNSLADWLVELLKGLTHLGYTTANKKTLPALTDASQSHFRDRLTSCLSHLVDLPLERAPLASALVVETLRESDKTLLDKLSNEAATVLKDARKNLRDATKKSSSSTKGTAAYMQAFRLLFTLGMLQVYKQEPDSIGVLEDINACYHSPKETGDASEMLVELLLSFVSKQSALFRKLAEQVFAAFASEVTEDGLQSMIDILSQKESLAGQQELFDQNDEDEADAGVEEEGDEDDEEEIDVEDMSDVELVNGEIVEKDDEGDDEDEDEEDSDESDSESDEKDEDEEAAFDRKLADALGTAGMESDEDEDGSDMDDEQMMALEPHLTNIFKERKKGSSKKQDNKDAKENIINFKNRVLDLLTVFVKSQYANVVTLNLIHPSVELTRTTSNQATARKALGVLEQYFDTCKRFKTGPKVDSSSKIFTLLDAVHEEIRAGGSKVHASACSRSSQFIAKLLVAKDEKHWEAVAGRYIKLQAQWRRDGEKSKIHPSVFNEWHSWSMQR